MLEGGAFDEGAAVPTSEEELGPDALTMLSEFALPFATGIQAESITITNNTTIKAHINPFFIIASVVQCSYYIPCRHQKTTSRLPYRRGATYLCLAKTAGRGKAMQSKKASPRAKVHMQQGRTVFAPTEIVYLKTAARGRS